MKIENIYVKNEEFFKLMDAHRAKIIDEVNDLGDTFQEEIKLAPFLEETSLPGLFKRLYRLFQDYFGYSEQTIKKSKEISLEVLENIDMEYSFNEGKKDKDEEMITPEDSTNTNKYIFEIKRQFDSSAKVSFTSILNSYTRKIENDSELNQIEKSSILEQLHTIYLNKKTEREDKKKKDEETQEIPLNMEKLEQYFRKRLMEAEVGKEKVTYSGLMSGFSRRYKNPKQWEKVKRLLSRVKREVEGENETEKKERK